MTMRHNNIRDFEASLLRIVHNNVEVEPHLQQVETMNSLMDSKKIMLVLILEQKVYGEMLKGVWRNAQRCMEKRTKVYGEMLKMHISM